MKNFKRFLCLLLTLLMLLGYVPGALPVSATLDDGICEIHHPIHDADCGYVAAADEVLCEHPQVCDETCKEPFEHCIFEHTDCGCIAAKDPVECSHDPEAECDYAERNAAITCDCPIGADGVSVHEEQCDLEARKAAVICNRYIPAVEAQYCDHQCTVDTGCITMVCSHREHDDTCGYKKAVEGRNCRFAGSECAQCAADAENTCHEKCALEDGHEGACTMFCGCPAVASEHLGTCTQLSRGAQTLPMYARIAGGDGNGNETVSYLESMTNRGNSTGPWLTFVASKGTDDAFVGFSTSDTEIVDLEYADVDSNDPAVRLIFGAPGEATITHTEGNTVYSFTVTVLEPAEVQYRMIPVQPTGNPNWLDLTGLEIGTGVKLRCMLAEMNGPPVSEALTGITSSDSKVFTVALSSDPTEASAGIHILMPVGPGKAQICYQQNGKEYFCEVGVLDKEFQADGLLYYPAVHIMSGKTYPCTVVDIPVEGGIAQKFYYSQPAEAMLLAEGDSDLAPLSITDVSWSGPITVVQPDNDTRLHISGTAAGTGYLEVTSEDGIVHCFTVNVGRDRPNTEIQSGGYVWLDDDTVLGFGNPGIASAGDNNAEPGVLKLRSQVNSGFGSMDYPEDFIYREPVAFAAMDQTDGKPDADIMAKVKNVTFSILACQNTDGTSGSYASVEKAKCEQIALTEGNVKAWTNYIVAGGTEAFKGLVGMTFDLPDTDGAGQTVTRRISLYILLHNTYMGQEVRVEANVTSAKQLNVILSSYEALKTWIKKEYPEYADAVDYACNVDLKLPHADLTDAVVVSEAIAPFPFRPNPSSNPNFRVYLLAPQQGDGTTMAGLISRGSLAGVFDVKFVADSNVTMKLGTEEFTCGLLADSTWSGDVEYDMDFAAKYGIDPTKNKRNLSSWTQDGDMKYADCDIMTVDGCYFEGFDYGTRSTPNGYVGGGSGNAIKKCYYGIYIDCEGKPGWGDIHYTGFSGYDFKKNVVAVRIAGLQENITPYEFRIHDSDFINNYLEFWIDKYDTTYLQNYYFYRNHYRGGWKLNSGSTGGDMVSGYGWVKHADKAPDSEDLPDVHRGPRYQVQDGDTIVNNGVSVTISGTPGKAVPNLAVNARAAAEGYWIYDGKDQITRIEQGGDKLPLAQESLEMLKQDAEVSVVKNQGTDTVAVWTFEGGA